MKKYVILLLPVFALFSCAQNKNTDNTNVDTTAGVTESVAFFPVTSFLQGQLQLLDSLPVTILQLSSINGKVDSAWLTADKVKPQLQPFFSTNIDKNNLTALFKETKFSDQTTEAITFTYGPKAALPDSMALRHWDVYVDPDKGTVRTVYIVRKVNENGMAATQQLTWQTGKWAKIVTINNSSESKPNEIKWIWDLNEVRNEPSSDKTTLSDK
jgi:hypothetical protein